MMNAEQANEFAEHRIHAWNAHDMEMILSHYTDDFEMSSPVIIDAMSEPSGTLKGKENIRAYWSKAFEKYPNLKFEKLHVLVGSNSVTIIYNGVRGLSAEAFDFYRVGEVHVAFADYALLPVCLRSPCGLDSFKRGFATKLPVIKALTSPIGIMRWERRLHSVWSWSG
jgi:hypothetical protein